MNTKVTAFRFVALAEGISFLFLLFVAMPLKYFGGLPEAVRYTGWLHGVLFMLYIPLLLVAASPLRWDFLMVLRGFIASLIPGGTFLLDRQIARDLKATEGSSR